MEAAFVKVEREFEEFRTAVEGKLDELDGVLGDDEGGV